MPLTDLQVKNVVDQVRNMLSRLKGHVNGRSANENRENLNWTSDKGADDD